MARLGRFGFVAIAVLFHAVYIISIFDVYFVSPIVHGMQAFAVQRPAGQKAPAQRVVLFVGDGLRADKAFQSFPDPSPADPNDPKALEPRPLMPFIRSKVEKYGTFGVSHTRVPTESRPGHVALIAGLYEDVSAVTTGWQHNPVNFDSVFNRSRHTWSWGSPDILDMFVDGADPGRVDGFTYPPEFEDASADAVELDTWVFDRVEQMFKDAAWNSTLAADLRKDKNVFFLHLLGIDTNGHAHRPYSREYLNNIKVVDAGVEKMVTIMENFFGDDQTAYVFTADHGMTDWGSHGDGDPDNTRTPLVVWGSGVRKPVFARDSQAPGHEDGLSHDWGFDHIHRHDVAQADVAALMAYLAGLDFPVNSVGELPLSYISADAAEQAEAALVNTKTILEMYRVKDERKSAVEIAYTPFAEFSEDKHPIPERIAAIRSLIDDKQYDSAMQASHDLAQLGIAGLRYLQTYDWLFLRILITLGYVGWIAFALTTVIDAHVLSGKTQESRTMLSTGFFGAILTGLVGVLVSKQAPYSYYLYAPFPVFFWEEVVARRTSVAKGCKVLLGHLQTPTQMIAFAMKALLSVAFLEGLVASYFNRTIYSFCYIASIAWPFLYGAEFVRANKILTLNWVVACGAMSVFTLLDAIKIEDSNTVLLGGSLMFSTGLLYLIFESRLITATPSASSTSQTSSWDADANATPTTATSSHNNIVGASASASSRTWSRSILGVQSGLILLAMIVTKSSIESLQARRGLPVGNQVVSWLTLIASLVVPFLHTMQPQTHYLHRLIVVFLTFSPTFIILTISYEGLFYFAFCVTLLTWVRLEHHVYTWNAAREPAPEIASTRVKPLDEAVGNIARQLTAPEDVSASHPDGTALRYRPLTLGDFRVAFFLLFLLQSGFFSVGNIASVSAFSLESVYRLVPVFDPFSQGALLAFKLLVPFAVISANLGILNRRLGVAPSSLFMLVIAICDALTLNFFWMVRDEGSWLDIGSSISHFIIASLLSAFVASLEVFSEVFMSGVEVDQGIGKVRAPQSNGIVVITNNSGIDPTNPRGSNEKTK